jgi:hypothetical protein
MRLARISFCLVCLAFLSPTFLCCESARAWPSDVHMGLSRLSDWSPLSQTLGKFKLNTKPFVVGKPPPGERDQIDSWSDEPDANRSPDHKQKAKERSRDAFNASQKFFNGYDAEYHKAIPRNEYESIKHLCHALHYVQDVADTGDHVDRGLHAARGKVIEMFGRDLVLSAHGLENIIERREEKPYMEAIKEGLRSFNSGKEGYRQQLGKKGYGLWDELESERGKLAGDMKGVFERLGGPANTKERERQLMGLIGKNFAAIVAAQNLLILWVPRR